MSGNIFEAVKEALHPKLASVLPDLLPGGRQTGREYVCASLAGGEGDSCKTNLDTGRGSDFSTGESWGDVIGLWAKIRGIRQGEAARELAAKYNIRLNDEPQAPQAVPAATPVFDLILPVPDNAPEPPSVHHQHGQASAPWRYADEEDQDIPLKEWPKFPDTACPGIVGDFVSLATNDSEADPAAVCVTMLTRFAVEVYGHAEGQGPYIHVGETIHPPRLFVVICGTSGKARKGTSLSPVTKLFSREHCLPDEMTHLPLSARESGGPLSTGEGLAYQVRDESEEERERRHEMNPNEPIRDPGDRRLMIQDEEFASGLACTKREGNTLSMGLRCFWDSGNYAPLTKNKPIRVKNAHICIVTHITMQELAVALADVQAFNGFGNRFLWICARRSKIIPWPEPMPIAKIRPIQQELWRLVDQAQKSGLVTMSAEAKALWVGVYPDLSREHSGLAGNIINRGEAQTLRLALIYALLDSQNIIHEHHLDAALALWRYAQESALYIFGDRSADPLEEKILEALKQGPLTATELSAVFGRNVSKDRLQPVLQQMEAQQRISITKAKGAGRPRNIISLREISTLNEKNEFNEFNEKREAVC